jgi:hypothetical protein
LRPMINNAIAESCGTIVTMRKLSIQILGFCPQMAERMALVKSDRDSRCLIRRPAFSS